MTNTTSARLTVFLAAAALTTGGASSESLAGPLNTLYAAGPQADTVVAEAGDPADAARNQVAAEAETADRTRPQAGVNSLNQVRETPTSGQTATALETDGGAYAVDHIEFTYVNQHPDLPAEAELQQVMVQLLPTPSGYVAPRPGAANQTLRLADLPHTGVGFMHASAANAIASAVVRDFQDRGLMGVFVSPDPTQIQVRYTPDGGGVWGDDLRAVSDDSLRLVIRSSIISEVRTVGQGDRKLDGSPINNPAHARILENSPLTPGTLARRDALDDYIFDLNRHPGRTVAAEIYPGEDPARGDAGLGYIVSEAKPWTAFFNLTNTGTSETSEFRERFGLLNTQLTGHDDVLSLEYITASFDESNAVFLSYERPFADNDRIHGRIFGSYQDYEASDVGFPGADFSGTTYTAGGELIWNFWQEGPAFLDLVGGARWENVQVSNPAGDQTEQFLIPYVGVAFERTTKTTTTTAYIGVEVNLDDVIGTNTPAVDGLGRLNTDADWVKVPFAFRHSFYLEPLFNRDKWLDISSNGSTLAHEIALSARGQWAPESRLNPQAQQVAGGLFTVRGYDEAIASGDTVIIASAEYRLHIPKLGAPRAGEQRQVDQFLGQPFRRFPQQPYGAADWDLIPKAFIDFGQTINNDSLAFESDETLVGAGVGVDFIYKRNLNLRVDYGVALQEAVSTTEGSGQFHFSFSFLY